MLIALPLITTGTRNLHNRYTENRKSILGSYDQLLNNKYKVQLNQKTIDRVKNYFK